MPKNICTKTLSPVKDSLEESDDRPSLRLQNTKKAKMELKVQDAP